MIPSFEKKSLDILIDLVYSKTPSLNEMAIIDRKKIIRKIDDFEDIITLHLIKILSYKDEDNLEKHLKDIDTWFQEIQKHDYNKKGKKLPGDVYFYYLFEEPMSDKKNEKFVSNTIKRRLKDYHNLARTGLSDKEIINYLYDIYSKASELISEDSLDDFKKDVWKPIMKGKI